MPRITIIISILLILVGVIGYVGGGMVSWTALIPSIAGALFLILGLIALKPGARKHAMHLVVALALLCTFMATSRLMKVMFPPETAATTVPAAEPVGTGLKYFSMGGMALLCLLLVIFGVKSFIDARRNRAAQTA